MESVAQYLAEFDAFKYEIISDYRYPIYTCAAYLVAILGMKVSTDEGKRMERTGLTAQRQFWEQSQKRRPKD